MNNVTYTGLPEMEQGKVTLSEYSPEWAERFQTENRALRTIFGPMALSIEHVGSTAIPGILAKPVIDVAVSVHSFADLAQCTSKLRSIGYVPKTSVTRIGRRFFVKEPDGTQAYYLHIAEEGSGYIAEMLLFRDYLRMHSEEAFLYSLLKENLSRAYKRDHDAYARNMAQFVRAILKLAKADGSVQNGNADVLI